MDKYLDLNRELKKLFNTGLTVTPIVFGALGMVLKGLERGLEELEIKEKNQDHPDYSIVEIG